MKVFLSYGHDSSSEGLVKRIKTDLSALGHEVWVDRDRIGFGDDWRREITDGIVESDQVLAFLSQHSTRDPGVCRDEIAIALGAGKAYVFTILLQSEQDVDLPLSVSHLQWLDMQDWQTRQQDPEQFEIWYAERLAKIIEVIDHPDNQRFAGEISQLEQYLKPLDCAADIYSRVQKFTGREWLIDELNQWREGDRQSRVFWLSGGPGVGKSAVAAWLAHSNRAQVIAAQFCRFNSPERREPTRVIRSIAFQLATRLPDYRRHLIHKPEIADLDRKNPSDLFDYLIADPLRYAIDGNRSRHLIVLDALDETLTEGKSDLTDLIASQVHKLPDWIGWVVTGRQEAPIRRQLEQFGIHELNADDPRNQQDIASHVHEWLSNRGLVDGQLLDTQDKVIEATQGNFLYLRQLELAVEQNIIDLKQLDDLPKGLSALFAREFRYRFFNVQAYENDILPLLEILVASSRPIPEADIQHILNCGKRQRIRLIEQLGSYVTETIDGIALFHKSLKDWLVDEKSAGADYFVEVANGHQVLGSVLWQQFTENPDLVDKLDSYWALELPNQLSHWSDTDLLKLVGDVAAQKYGDCNEGFIGDETLLFSKHEQQKRWGYLWLRMGELGLGSNHQFISDITNCLGMMFRHQGDYNEAELLLRRSLILSEQNIKPNYIQIGRSLNNLATIIADQGSYREAELYYHRALEIAQNELGVEHEITAIRMNNLGLLLWKQGKYIDSEYLLRSSLTITEKVSRDDFLAISTSLNNLALLFISQSNYREAEQLLNRAIIITDREFEENHPNKAIYLSNLALVLNLNGDNIAAELMIRKSLLINEQALGEEHPETGKSLNNLALLLQNKGDYEAAESLFRRALTITERSLGKEHPETGILLNNLGLMLCELGDYEGAQPLLTRALAIAENSLGTEHPETAVSLNNLGLMFDELADYSRAEPLLRRALSVTENNFGIDHYETHVSLKKLGKVLRNNHKLEESESVLRNLLTRSEKTYGLESKESISSLIELGITLICANQQVEGKQLYEKAFKISSNLLGADAPETVVISKKIEALSQ